MGALVTMALLIRRAILLLDLGYRVGELVKVGAEGAQEVQERVPADASVAVLHLRDVRGADLGTACELLLRKPCPITQCAQSPTKGQVVTGGVVGGLDDLCGLYR
jgi:hypothetical protein